MPQSIQKFQAIDGDIAMLLRALRNHTSRTEDELRLLANTHLANENIFPHLISELRTGLLVTDESGELKLTEDGESWLDSHASELTVEEEDLTVEDKLDHPYEVAKLKMETKHLSVFQALRKLEKNEINLNPEFQRAFVWDRVKQSRLIESVLIRIPLPAFYLDATDQTRWSVVDGLQRLTTLFNYCRKSDFALEGLQFLTELTGLKFDDLPSKYKVLIEDDTQLLFYNLMPGTPLEAKYTIFSRVNTGGMQLTPQEIRHALNQGPSTRLLERLASNDSFRFATRGLIESLRMSDRELILRSLSFSFLGYEAYREVGDMDTFLLRAMALLNKESPIMLKTLEDEFLLAIDKVGRVFGRYSYRKFTEVDGRRYPFNKALFEVWTVAVKPYSAATLLANRKKILDAFASMVNLSPQFVRSISSSTASYSAVSTRFSAIQSLLAKACI